MQFSGQCPAHRKLSNQAGGRDESGAAGGDNAGKQRGKKECKRKKDFILEVADDLADPIS